MTIKPLLLISSPASHIGTWILKKYFETDFHSKYNLVCCVDESRKDLIDNLIVLFPRLEDKIEIIDTNCRAQWRKLLDKIDIFIHLDLTHPFDNVNLINDTVLSAAIRSEVKKVIMIDDGSSMFSDWSVDAIDGHTFRGGEKTGFNNSYQELCDDSKNTQFFWISPGITLGELLLDEPQPACYFFKYLCDHAFVVPLKTCVCCVEDCADFTLALLSRDGHGEHFVLGTPMWNKDVGSILYDAVEDSGIKASTWELSPLAISFLKYVYPDWYLTIEPIKDLLAIDYFIDNKPIETILGRSAGEVTAQIKILAKDLVDNGFLKTGKMENLDNKISSGLTGDENGSFGRRMSRSILQVVQDKPMPIDEMASMLSSFILWETFTLALGFSPYIYVFAQTGIWYLNPLQRAMENPWQFIVNSHITFGVLVMLGIAYQGLCYRWGGRWMKYGHRRVGYGFIPIMSVIFLVLSVIAECSLPSKTTQKVARLALVPWCFLTLIFIIYYAYIGEIRGHLTMVCCFWGLCCSAGTLRGVAQLSSWLANCQHGYGNPVFGIVIGPLFSTTIPVVYYVYKTRSFHFKFGKAAIFFSTFYLWLFPLYPTYFFTICSPRQDWSLIYPNYPFWMPGFSEDSFINGDDNDDGYLSFCEFRHVMDSYNIDNQILSDSITTGRLLKLAKDNDGSIELNNFDTFCIDMHHKDFMKLEFVLYDIDNDEQLSLAEFQSYLHALTLRNDVIEAAWGEDNYPETIVHHRTRHEDTQGHEFIGDMLHLEVELENV